MRTFKYRRKEIVLYDSIEELPFLRFQKFNKLCMMDSEVGSTFKDFDVRLAKALEFIRKEMRQEALNELDNFRISISNSFSEVSTIGNAFAVLVHSIEGVEYPTWTDDGLKKCLEHLERIGLSSKEAISQMREVKKKSIWNWKRFFQRSSKAEIQK